MFLKFMVTNRCTEHYRKDRQRAVGDGLERKDIANVAAEHVRQRNKKAGDRGHPPADAYHDHGSMHARIFRGAALEEYE